MKIAIGTRSYHKLSALRLACMKLGVHPLVKYGNTGSGQNPQPVGWDETFAGALERARTIKARYSDCLAIGIESGIFRFGKETPITLDIAVIVLITADDRVIVTTSTGIVFPEKYVAAAETAGFGNSTVGEEVAKELGGDPTDPHSTLTNGNMDRTMTMVDALYAALVQAIRT